MSEASFHTDETEGETVGVDDSSNKGLGSSVAERPACIG